jgi:hypothetical protein
MAPSLIPQVRRPTPVQRPADQLGPLEVVGHGILGGLQRLGRRHDPTAITERLGSRLGRFRVGLVRCVVPTEEADCEDDQQHHHRRDAKPPQQAFLGL